MRELELPWAEILPYLVEWAIAPHSRIKKLHHENQLPFSAGKMYTPLMMTAAEHSILERVTFPVFHGLSSEAARAILRMKFSPADIRRIHVLSARASRGDLTQDQRGQLDVYLQIGHMLTLLHSKA
ncbi:MAG TPA: hypothetical protein VGN88_12555, partial [Phycisphaerae bacterium]